MGVGQTSQRQESCWLQSFKKKEEIPGVEAPRYKARFVAKGYNQVEIVDFNEVFPQVVKYSSVRVLI